VKQTILIQEEKNDTNIKEIIIKKKPCLCYVINFMLIEVKPFN